MTCWFLQRVLPPMAGVFFVRCCLSFFLSFLLSFSLQSFPACRSAGQPQPPAQSLFVRCTEYVVLLLCTSPAQTAQTCQLLFCIFGLQTHPFSPTAETARAWAQIKPTADVGLALAPSQILGGQSGRPGRCPFFGCLLLALGVRPCANAFAPTSQPKGLRQRPAMERNVQPCSSERSGETVC